MRKRVFTAAILGATLAAASCGGDSEVAKNPGAAGATAAAGTTATAGTTGAAGTTAAAGTTGAAGGAGTGGAAGVPLEELPARAATAFCTAFGNCLGELVDLWMGGEDCETLMTRTLEDEFGILSDAIEAGSVVYHPELVPACLQLWQGRSCEELNHRSIQECADAIEGTVAVNGECTMDMQCDGFHICKFDGQCPGTCTPRGSAGTRCTRDDECDDGLVCFSETGRCIAPRAETESCGGGVEPECVAGLVCIGQDEEEGTPGTCGPISEAFTGEVGDTCGPDGSSCQLGLSCTVVDVLLNDQLQLECASPVGSGETCRIGFPKQCPPDELCDNLDSATLQGTCVALPGEGQPCAQRFDDDDYHCAPYTRCDLSTGNCRALQRLGATCSADDLCYSGNCVDGGCASESACEP